MTTVYQWFSFPEEFQVICPSCGDACRGMDVEQKHKSTNGSVSKVRHSRTEEGSNGSFLCDLSCIQCGYNKQQVISWPEQAYWKFNVKGELLWAWSLEHAQVLLNYFSSGERQEFGTGYASSLLHIPKHFKLAKNRNDVVKAISNKGVSLNLP